MSVITFPAPPKDFDPLTASDRSLAKFGLPRRPDPDTEPELRKLWDEAFARKPTFVEAELVEDQPWPSRPRGAGKKDRFGSAGQGAGAYVDVSSLGLSPAEPANMVFAEWKVPTISTKPKEPGQQSVAFWVGLGGVALFTGDVPALLQAGTAAGITDGEKPVTYWAWTEWVPKGGGGAGPQTVYTRVKGKKKKFEVKPGDVMSVLVCAPESNHGYVNMWNHRTNEIVSIGVSTGKIDGSTVDWIVEAPYTEVPNFGSVKFTNISAGTKNHVIDLSHATVTNIYNAPALTKVLATGSILLKKNEVEVTWNAAQ